MHELSLALSLVDEVEKILVQEKATALNCINLMIGTWSGVDKDSFETIWEFAIEGTKLEGAKLNIELVTPKIECSDCHTVSPLTHGRQNCPHCKSKNVSLVSGREFKIQSIDIETA